MQKEKVVKQDKTKGFTAARILYEAAYIASQNGRRVGTFEIQSHLEALGINVDIRTVQRDLKILSKHFVHLKSDNCSPQGFYFAKDKESQFIAELLKEVA